jgi:hypothetical protein
LPIGLGIGGALLLAITAAVLVRLYLARLSATYYVNSDSETELPAQSLEPRFLWTEALTGVMTAGTGIYETAVQMEVGAVWE